MKRAVPALLLIVTACAHSPEPIKVLPVQPQYPRFPTPPPELLQKSCHFLPQSYCEHKRQNSN